MIDRLLAHRDITFVTLTRRDIASQAASLLVAGKTDSWDQSSSVQGVRFNLDRRSGPILAQVTAMLAWSNALVEGTNALPLAYEDLCQPDYDQSAALDRVFGQRIDLRTKRSPVSAECYVDRWPAFQAFVWDVYERSRSRPDEVVATHYGVVRNPFYHVSVRDRVAGTRLWRTIRHTRVAEALRRIAGEVR